LIEISIADFLVFITDDSHHMSQSTIHTTNTGAVHNPIFADWIFRQGGFERLEQYPGGKNTLNDDKAADDFNNEIVDEVVAEASHPKHHN
jgi:hypothetical protein